MEEFIKYASQFGHLTEQQIQLIAARAKTLQLKKDDYFSESGKIPRQVGFVIKGVIRGFYYNGEGEETTRCLISEGNLVADYVNFEANITATEYLQACTDCRLIVFSKQHWNELSQIVAGWDNIKNKMVQICMHQKSRKGPVISQDATSRYLDFLENHPSLAHRIPLAYIASYLGVTQQSLSRIRKSIR